MKKPLEKPLGELYSGGPEKSIEAELNPREEKVPTYIKELRSNIELAAGRVQLIHEALRKLGEDLNLVHEKIDAMPLKLPLAAERGGAETEKALSDLEMLQDFSKEIEAKMKEKMDMIKEWEEKIKKMEEKLVDGSWKDEMPPSIGEA